MKWTPNEKAEITRLMRNRARLNQVFKHPADYVDSREQA